MSYIVLATFGYETVQVSAGHGQDFPYLSGASVERAYVESLETELFATAGRQKDNKTAVAFQHYKHGSIVVASFFDGKATFVDFGEGWVIDHERVNGEATRAIEKEGASIPANIGRGANIVKAAIVKSLLLGRTLNVHAMDGKARMCEPGSNEVRHAFDYKINVWLSDAEVKERNARQHDRGWF